MSFQEVGLGLDHRLLRALAKRGLTKPTLVQSECIPKVLEGKDIVARARTGSGKTLAYLLPALHKVLTADEHSQGSWQALIMIPTKELCEQVKQEAGMVAMHCGMDISVTTLVAETPAALRIAVAQAGHVVISTPGRMAAALKLGLVTTAVLAARLQLLVLDEADLLLSYGYEEDLQALAPQVPRSCQCMLMSATASDDLERLTKLLLHNPEALNLLEATGKGGSLTAGGSGVAAEIEHFAVDVAPGDRLLATMAILKLGLVRKKVLVFVNGVDSGYKVRLFLESFGIRSALLHAELPVNSRSHILATFNRGVFDYLIATDDVHGVLAQAPVATPGKKKRKHDQPKGGNKKRAKEEEFGVTRGIDFKGVRTIINYDLPTSLEGYVHRVGRTGRAGESGIAITLFTPQDEAFRKVVETAMAEQQPEVGAEGDPVPLAGLGDEEEDDEEGAAGGKRNKGLKPFSRLTKASLEALRYRGEDVARMLSKSRIKEARARELREELLNSEKLKEYFEAHDAERQLLRHDKALHKTPQAPHLKHVPGYLRDPAALAQEQPVAGGRPSSTGKQQQHKRRRTDAGGAGAAGGAAVDPLKAVGFLKARRRGGDHDEEMTEMEKRAEVAAKKQRKKMEKMGTDHVVALRAMKPKHAKRRR